MPVRRQPKPTFTPEQMREVNAAAREAAKAAAILEDAERTALLRVRVASDALAAAEIACKARQEEADAAMQDLLKIRKEINLSLRKDK